MHSFPHLSLLVVLRCQRVKRLSAQTRSDLGNEVFPPHLSLSTYPSGDQGSQRISLVRSLRLGSDESLCGCAEGKLRKEENEAPHSTPFNPLHVGRVVPS